jgi:hypothetical protein
MSILVSLTSTGFIVKKYFIKNLAKKYSEEKEISRARFLEPNPKRRISLLP